VKGPYEELPHVTKATSEEKSGTVVTSIDWDVGSLLSDIFAAPWKKTSYLQ